MDSRKASETSTYSAALYMRLSRDDEGPGESASIDVQRRMLRNFARENHYHIYAEYADDGVSGTTFDRPAFRRMIRDIEEKKVNMVITKDLSRLGRDYILTGQYTEIYFPGKKVRCIAVNDGYDSDNPGDDMAPFRNVVNEMYARDISRKIRSAFAVRMREGDFVGAFAPYGYKRDPKDRHRLAIDEAAAEIVRDIFRRAAGGMNPSGIARVLNEGRIPTPIQYRYLHRPSLCGENVFGHREWTSSTICKMLKNPVYLGHMVQGKTAKASFKSNATMVKPKEDWYVVENTHEALVSAEIFDQAARKSKMRACEKKGRFQNVFSGIAVCADCGRGLSTAGSRKKGALANLACGGYKLYGKEVCSNHFIDYTQLYEAVFSSLKEQLRISEKQRQAVIEKAALRIRKGGLAEDRYRAVGRLKEDSLKLTERMRSVYEDRAEGRVSPESMSRLLAGYEAKLRETEAQIAFLESGLRKAVPAPEELGEMLQGILEPKELTREILSRFIGKIQVGQGVFRETEEGRKKFQEVEIIFYFREPKKEDWL